MNLRGLAYVCRNKLLSGFLSLLFLSAVVLGTPLSEDKPVTPDISCRPLSCVRGVIQITYSANGKHLGYISNTYASFANQGTEYYLVTPSIGDALIVYLPSTNIATDLRVKSFNIFAANPANSNWHYLGAAADIVSLNLEDAPNMAVFTGTKITPVGPPQVAAVQEISDLTFRGESQIWFLGCFHEFFSVWTNEDGTTSRPNYFYWPTGGPGGLLGMAVNVAAVSAEAAEVTFTFIPQCTCPSHCVTILGCIC